MPSACRTVWNSRVAGADIGQGHARSGLNNGWLFAGHGWAAERVRVPVSSWQNRSNCAASVYARPVADGAQVGVQVWDPNGWRLLAESYPWLDGDRHQWITTGSLNTSQLDTVYVQVIFGKDSPQQQYVRIDDVSFRCES